MATVVRKVPAAIAKEGLKTAGGQFQENKYGPNMRVCNTCGPDNTRYRETVTNQEFSGSDLTNNLKKKK